MWSCSSGFVRCKFIKKSRRRRSWRRWRRRREQKNDKDDDDEEDNEDEDNDALQDENHDDDNDEDVDDEEKFLHSIVELDGEEADSLLEDREGLVASYDVELSNKQAVVHVAKRDPRVCAPSRHWDQWWQRFLQPSSPAQAYVSKRTKDVLRNAIVLIRIFVQRSTFTYSLLTYKLDWLRSIGVIWT